MKAVNKKSQILGTSEQDVAGQGPETPSSGSADPPKDQFPSIVMIQPHGFYDDSGALNYWRQGQKVTDQAEIELLVNRGANFREATADDKI